MSFHKQTLRASHPALSARTRNAEAGAMQPVARDGALRPVLTSHRRYDA